MPNRILKDSICTSEDIAALDWAAEVFWYRLIVQCDDYGRMDARPAILRARCYPLAMARVNEADITAWLVAFQNAGMVQLYTVAGKPYLRIPAWDKHQQVRAKRSKYPDMIADANRCYQAQSSDGICPRESESESESESEGESKAQAPVPPLPAAPSSTAGRRAAATLTALNDQLAPALRRPLADAILNLTGKRALADAGGEVGDRLTQEAHAAAVTLYRMGLRTESEILALEPAWAVDWRGKQGGSITQFLAFVSEVHAGKHNSGEGGNGKNGRNSGAQLGWDRRHAAAEAEWLAAGGVGDTDQAF